MDRSVVSKVMWARRARTFAFWLLALVVTVLISLMLGARPAHADTFTVNLTGDENDLDFPGGTFDGSSDGKCFVGGLSAVGDECTLRAAIQAANKLAGADAIAFNIPGNGPHTITPSTNLPTITKPVTIDGYTQGDTTATMADDATENTLTQPGKTNAQLKIELNGTSAGMATGLRIAGTSSTPAPNNVVIRGLVINRFFLNGILAGGGTGHMVDGNFIGTDTEGDSDLGNRVGGVIFFDTDGSAIGGSSPQARNLISGNESAGVVFIDSLSGNKIQGNLIGTDKTGTAPLGNSGSGVSIEDSSLDSSNNTVGDADASDGATNAANTIAFNGEDGVRVSESATGNRILSNSIFSNGGLGIDLGGEGHNANDLDDSNTPKPDPDKDIGPNNLQNFPTLSSADISLIGNTTITGELNSTPSTRKKKRTFIIQFFSSPQKDPSGLGEGKTFLGQIQRKTDRQGKAPISFFTQATSEGEFITATATNKKTGDTSEFSTAKIVEEPVIGGG